MKSVSVRGVTVRGDGVSARGDSVRGDGVHLGGRLLVEVGGLGVGWWGEREEMLDALAVLQLTDLEPVVLGMEPQNLFPLLE